MQPEPFMARGPTPKKKKVKVLGYRATPEIEAWVSAKQVNGASQSDVMGWAMQLAHDYYEAARPVEGRIRKLAEAEGLTQLGILRRIISAGVDALERELAEKK
jgi:ABC-type sugar transport system substrate-binding protein